MPVGLTRTAIRRAVTVDNLTDSSTTAAPSQRTVKENLTVPWARVTGAPEFGMGDMLAEDYDANADGKVDAADEADAVPWSGVTGKPSTFTPSSHEHPQSEVTGLAASLAAKADLVGGYVPTSQIPAVAITEFLGTVASQSAMLALAGDRGDWCIRTDTGTVFILNADDSSLLASWTEVEYPAAPVSSVNGQTGVIVLGASDVGASASGHDHDDDYDAIGAAAAVADAVALDIAALESAHDALELHTGWYTTPEDHGAVGDGVTDDTAALKAALLTEKTVVLSPVATYLVTQPLRLLAGKTIVGNRATLKRGPQYSTTTSDSITDGVTTSITVADASDFKADDWVFLTQGSTYSPTLRRILSIAGNVLTFSSALSGTWSGTTTVRTAWTFITSETGYGRLLDIRFDGSKADWTYNRWEILSEVALTGEHSLMRGCVFEDSPGEAIVCYGDHHLIQHCHGSNLNGNGIHWSGGSHSIADSCTFLNTNLDTDLGHQEGNITWSIECDNVTVTNCWLENGITGLGGMADPTDSQVRIIGNTIVNPTTYGLHFDCGSTTLAVNQSAIIGNRFYGGEWGIVATNGQAPANADGFLKGLTIQGNNFAGQSVGAMTLTRLSDSSISGNTIDNRGATGDQILVTGCDGIAISDNSIHGGSSGVRLGASSTRVSIDGNMLRGQSSFGVAYDSSVGDSNVARSNTILNEAATSANGYVGINCNHRVWAENNHITLTSNGGALTAVRGIQVNSVPYTTTTTGPGAICCRNTIIGTSQYGIRLDGGTGKAVVTDNNVTSTTIISNGGGVHNGQSAAGSYTGTITAGALQTGAYITISDGGNGYVGSTVNILLKQDGMDTPGNYALATGTLVNGVVSSATITSGGSGFTTGQPVTLHFGGSFVAHNSLLGTGANEDPLAATPILKNYSIQRGTPVTLTVAASIAINAALGTEATITITQNTTITMTGALLGRRFDLHIYTAGVYTVTFSTGTASVPVLTTTANKFHHVSLWSNGSNFYNDRAHYTQP